MKDEFDSFENIVTLNAVLVEGDSIQVHLSFSDELNDNPLRIIKNAQIEAIINNSVIDSLNYFEEGIYKGDYICKPGDHIYIHVITSDGEIVSATTDIPEISKIVSDTIIENAWVDNEGNSQPALLLILLHDTSKTEYFELIIQSSGEKLSLLVNDKESNNDSLKVNFPFKKDNSSSFQIKLRTVSYSYYEYIRTYKLYLDGRYPEFGVGTVMPYNIYSNINNGLGIFCSYTPSGLIQFHLK